MKNSGQNTVAIVVLLLVIVIAAAFIAKQVKPKRYPRPYFDWTCEVCQHRFVAEAQRESRACPQCGREGVRTHYFYCALHDHLFEGYRSKPDPDVDVDPDDPSPGPIPKLYKLTGGEWVKEQHGVDTFAGMWCPEGNYDRKTFIYCPPGAEQRQ